VVPSKVKRGVNLAVNRRNKAATPRISGEGNVLRPRKNKVVNNPQARSPARVSRKILAKAASTRAAGQRKAGKRTSVPELPLTRSRPSSFVAAGAIV
jgi:hypothetical protein